MSLHMAEPDRLYVKERDKTFSIAWIVKDIKNVKSVQLFASSTPRTVKNVQIHNFWLG